MRSVYSIPLFLLRPHPLPEPECCDGSDEPSGVCPNICDQVGTRYRALLEQKAKLRNTVRYPRFISQNPLTPAHI